MNQVSGSSFSLGRTYYITWTIDGRVVSDNVRPFTLHNDSRMLLIFVNEIEALACEAIVPHGTLSPAPVEHRRMRMCSTSKSFCPLMNFSGANSSLSLAAASCAIHLPVRAHVRSDIHNGGGSSSQGSLQSSAAQSQQRTDSSSDDSASERSVSAAPKKRSRGGKRVVPSPLYTEDRRSDEDIADEFLTFAQTDELHAMYQEVVVGNSTCISSTADSLPAMSTTATSDPRCVAMVATPVSSGLPASTMPLQATAPLVMPIAAQPELINRPHVDAGNVTVNGSLMVHGETRKASGSPAWTVVSDARVKEIMSEFPLGLETVMAMRPKIFRYNGKGGTTNDGKLYVGLIAQEVPPELAPYCRLRTKVRLEPADAEETEIMMLDHSSFPFLCINALQEHEQRLQAVEAAVSVHQQAGASNGPMMVRLGLGGGGGGAIDGGGQIAVLREHAKACVASLLGSWFFQLAVVLVSVAAVFLLQVELTGGSPSTALRGAGARESYSRAGGSAMRMGASGGSARWAWSM